MADAAPLRLFIAVELPEEIRQILAEVTARLRQQLGGPYRWVAAGNIHLTLRFLGDVEAGRVGALGEALAGGGRSLTPFTLALEGTGTAALALLTAFSLGTVALSPFAAAAAVRLNLEG